MSDISTVEEYIDQYPQWSEGLSLIAAILERTEMVPTIKWNMPVYTLNQKNVIGLGAFKWHYGIWFYNGVFLSDPARVLINAQKEKTKALRQMRFTTIDIPDKALVEFYVSEAIDLEKQGKRLTIKNQGTDQLQVPELLNDMLNSDQGFKTRFIDLSPFKQKEYCEYIDSAKRDQTKQTRLNKIVPMIMAGVGLNEKYRS